MVNGCWSKISSTSKEKGTISIKEKVTAPYVKWHALNKQTQLNWYQTTFKKLAINIQLWSFCFLTISSGNDVFSVADLLKRKMKCAD